MKKKSFLIIICVFACIHSGLVYSDTTYTNDICLYNTSNDEACKDCCDCIDGDAEARKICRDNCMTHDYSSNTNTITVNVSSVLGPDGDYSSAINLSTEQECKAYCDGSANLACGDRRHCRDACNAHYSDPNNNDPNNNDPNGQGISIDQAVSDLAQRNTIAFDALAFITGDLCDDTFLPPGKVADFSGFQYLRDTDPTNLGHNTDFVTIIAFNMLNILNESQIQSLISLAKTQIDMISEYGYKRFPLIKAFRRLYENDLPDGTTGLDKEAVMQYSADLYRLDGQISYDRAVALGNILRGFSSDQKSQIDTLKTLNGVGNWDFDSSQRNPLSDYKLERDENVAVMTYASEMYSWYAGSVEGDTYFCPERQGTYFGSFYMKDAPAMAAGPGFTIDSNLTANMGSSLIAALTAGQAELITGLVDIQRDDLYGIVDVRRDISTELRKLLTSASIDEDHVLSLAEQYGELDGAIVYQYATHFAEVGKTLTTDQKATIQAIRESWNTIPCEGAYLYSEKISMPEIMNTDFLFGVDSGSTSDIIAENASLNQIVQGLAFAEGPVADTNGNLYFSDIDNNIIYKWSESDGTTVFQENSNGTNGLYMDQGGTLYTCEGANGRLLSIDSQGNVSVLAEEYNGKAFNEPNDLWIDPKGGIYFSDPVYKGTLVQDGEHVYYLTPKRDQIIRVVNDMVRPNGIIGSDDGQRLYIADHGAGITYQYDIEQNGSLSNKSVFVSTASDGMTIDENGNVYLTNASSVLVYDTSGNLVETIVVPEETTNVCFGGIERQTLYITAKSSVYSIEMTVKGLDLPSVNSDGSGIDVINDGKIDLRDAIRILQIISGF
jgi:sugar lactone lactonase YvrE